MRDNEGSFKKFVWCCTGDSSRGGKSLRMGMNMITQIIWKVPPNFPEVLQWAPGGLMGLQPSFPPFQGPFMGHHMVLMGHRMVSRGYKVVSLK